MIENLPLSILRELDEPADFVRLPSRVQGQVADRLAWIRKLIDAEHGTKGTLVSAAAAALGVSSAQVYKLAKAYRRRGWRGLVDGRALVGASKGLPGQFKSYVQKKHLEQSRETTGREVHRQILEQWRTWQKTGDPKHAIPGYRTPPAAGPKGYPAGWSEDNILRLRPDSYARAVARRGSKPAAKFLPSILKTRQGAKFGQVVFFDDQDYDLKIVAPGTSQKTVRPQGFNAIDYLSGCFLDYSLRFRYWDTEEKKFRALTQTEFTWFVLKHLQETGYRDDEVGTTLVFEHGTATGYSNRELETFGGHHNFDEALAAISKGKISVERSGLFNKPAFADLMFKPQSSGNPNFKAPVESMFNLVRNRMAALPGPTGRHRDLKPGEQYGLEKYAEKLLALYEQLPAERRELLRFPILTAHQFGQVAASVYEAINARHDHALEGWERCGFTLPQIRFTPDDRSPWLSQQEIADLPPETQDLALALADRPGHVRPWKLSPIEVANAHRKELKTLGDWAVPLLIPRQWSRVAKVTSKREIEIRDQLLGPEKLVYLARIETRHGFETLKVDQEFRCYLNPFLPEKLVVCDLDGRFIGTLHERTRCAWNDADAITTQLSQRAEIKADLDSGVRPHMAGLADQRAADAETNRRLADGRAVTDEERTAERSEAGQRGARTRKDRALRRAIEARGMTAEALREDTSETDLQDHCTDTANPFDPSQLLTPDED